MRKRNPRKRETAEQREREKKRQASRSRRKVRPFMAVDGEGGGTDEVGRQNYFLMATVAGTSEAYICHAGGEALMSAIV
jgi:hypothetical protein